jgi:hypothetical protein
VGDVARFRCSECNTESEVSAKNGREVVALYCLRHTGGADGHTRPVYMTCVEASVAATLPQPPAARPAAAGATNRQRTRSRTERSLAEQDPAQSPGEDPRPAAVSV